MREIQVDFCSSEPEIMKSDSFLMDEKDSVARRGCGCGLVWFWERGGGRVEDGCVLDWA